MRAAVAAGTPSGRMAKEIMDAGGLVGDEVVLALLKERLAQPDTKHGVIFDGYPRTLAQAEALDTLISEEGLLINFVAALEVGDEDLVERISKRFTCASCGEGYHEKYKNPIIENTCDRCGGSDFTRRADDNPSTVRNRLHAYHQQTAPVLDRYENANLVRRLSGDAKIEEIYASLQQMVREI